VKNYLEVTGIEADMEISLAEDISEDLKVNLYRIIKEIFTNIIRHSGAGKVRLRLHRSGDHISLVISDDGVGFVQGERRGDRRGYGLSNIRQRVNEFNGSMKIETAPGKGTTTFIEMGIKQL
jgi:signal transduction histidine kinase